MRTLTAVGRQTLRNFQDLTIMVPVTELQFENDRRGWNPDAKATFYPISENSMPGMIAALQDTVPLAFVNRLEDLRAFPPAFKTWVLSQLTDDLEEPIDQGSDRAWFYNAARAWFMSVQHVELRHGVATLVTDLADRPMNGTTLVFQDIPYSWHLSGAAFAPFDCVPFSLAEALDEDQDFCKLRLENAAKELKQNPSEGFTRKAICKFLQEYSEHIGKQVGWKVIVNGVVQSSRKAEKMRPLWRLRRRRGTCTFIKRTARACAKGTRKPRKPFAWESSNTRARSNRFLTSCAAAFPNRLFLSPCGS